MLQLRLMDALKASAGDPLWDFFNETLTDERQFFVDTTQKLA